MANSVATQGQCRPKGLPLPILVINTNVSYPVNHLPTLKCPSFTLIVTILCWSPEKVFRLLFKWLQNC